MRSLLVRIHGAARCRDGPAARPRGVRGRGRLIRHLPAGHVAGLPAPEVRSTHHLSSSHTSWIYCSLQQQRPTLVLESLGTLAGRMLSPEGACKSFDASGNGYARAEGVAAIILRRSDVAAATPWVLKRAPAATIVGMGTNNDGHTEQGITFPSGPAQRELGTAVRRFPADRDT